MAVHPTDAARWGNSPSNLFGGHVGSFSVFVRTGRSRKWVPEFAFNDSSFRDVLIRVDVDFLKERKRAFYARGPAFTAAIERAGSHRALVAAVVYHAWRLRWPSRDIALDMGLRTRQVNWIILKVLRTARQMGFPTITDTTPARKNVTTEEILELFNQRVAIRDIAQRFGLHRATVKERLKSAGVYKHSARVSTCAERIRHDHLADQMVPLLYIGTPWNVIARQLGCTWRTVRKIAREHAVTSL
jgi:hypothetical protein